METQIKARRMIELDFQYHQLVEQMHTMMNAFDAELKEVRRFFTVCLST
jgi:hypothetical protein